MQSNAQRYIQALLNKEKAWSTDNVDNTRELADMVCGEEGCKMRCQTTDTEPCEAMKFLVRMMLWNGRYDGDANQPSSFIRQHDTTRKMIMEYCVATYA